MCAFLRTTTNNPSLSEYVMSMHIFRIDAASLNITLPKNPRKCQQRIHFYLPYKHIFKNIGKDLEIYVG